MNRGEVNFKRIGIYSGDNDFYMTYSAVLNLVVLGLKDNMWQLEYKSDEKSKAILNDKNTLKEYICELINQTINSICLIYQHGAPGKVDFYKEDYLHIKPNNLYLDEEVEEFINSDEDGWHNGEFFSLYVNAVDKNLFNNVQSN